MRRAITLRDMYLQCIHCHQQYDLKRASQRAEKLNNKEIRCPKCGNIVARR